MNQAAFDRDLLNRYDGCGPRYTSYPTAQEFHTDFDALDYRRAALLSNASSLPLSMYVHIPFCESPCFYCGCNRLITRDRSRARDYLDLLATEIQLQAALFDPVRPVDHLHFGGGTPTYLSMAQLRRVLEVIRGSFRVERDAELSIEVDPRTVSAQGMGELAALNFNRISFGIQDFDPRVQFAVNRIQSFESVQTLVTAARTHGFPSVSFDLIYGLPRQTLDSFRKTLERVIELRPDRIAAYGYAHLPQTFKAQGKIRAEELPSSADRVELLALTVEMLTAAGYLHIGLDHFALADDELAQALRRGELQRNFQGYSTRAGNDLIGVGISAISKVGNAFAQNFKRMDRYVQALREHTLPIERGLLLNTDDRLRADIIQQLMCEGSVDRNAIESRYAIDFGSYFHEELQALQALSTDRLVELNGHYILVTASGRFLLRNIAMIFDRYRARQTQGALSKTL